MAIQNALSTAYLPAHRSTLTASHRSETGFYSTVLSVAGMFSRHPLPILLCTLVCFAGAGAIGSLVYGAMIGEAVLRTGSHTTTTLRAYNTQMLVQALIGALTFLLGRGALTWIALQDDARSGDAITFRAAMLTALRRWQPLLLSTLLYGGLITLGVLGLTALLRELRLDVSNTRSIRIVNFDNIMHWTMIRTINLLPPDPGSPFSDWLAAMRYNIARTMVGSYFGFDLATAPRAVNPQTVVIGLASLALLIVADGLLCLRTAAIFASPAGNGRSWLHEALRVSSTHFSRVLAWRWAVRLTLIAFAAVTLVLLPALHQMLVVGQARQILSTGYWSYHIAQSAYGVGIALTNGLLIAIGVIFEARIYRSLA